MGRISVSPAELGGAASTLGRVSGELDQSGDLGLGAEALGSPELAVALADFCQKAGSLATQFQATVAQASSTVAAAGSSYDRTEQGVRASMGP